MEGGQDAAWICAKWHAVPEHCYSPLRRWQIGLLANKLNKMLPDHDGVLLRRSSSTSRPHG